jgi:nicotinamidase-related amidase
MPIPSHFNPGTVGQVWRVSYQDLAIKGKDWTKEYKINPAYEDKIRTCLLAIDVQNTFCIPDFELFVGGRSGMGAVEDNIRLCEFIYRHLQDITEIIVTMDTHTSLQIFHPVFWVDKQGDHPTPMTSISLEDVEAGKWKVNPNIAYSVVKGNYSESELQKFGFHYVKRLSEDGKYPLTIWPYHSMLGGIGHALVSAVEEACFFHGVVRGSQTNFEMKGNNPLTENYSVLRPEVLQDSSGQVIAQKNTSLIEKLLDFDRVIIAGQAKSHCVAWTIDDLLSSIQAKDPNLAKKVYLLEDCTSPVVVPGIVDYTDQAIATFKRFADAGMNVINSSQYR